MLREFVNDWHFQVKLVTKGENKARLNSFEPHKDEDVEWMRNLLNSRVEAILEKVKERRGQEAYDFAKTADMCFGHKAKECKLVDEVVEAPELYLKERFGIATQIKQ